MKHADLVSLRQLRALAAPHRSLAVSIYVPTSPTETQQAPLELKNLGAQARTLLESRGVDLTPYEPQFDRLEELRHETPFWSYQAHSLAILFTPEEFHQFRIPLRVARRVEVASTFYLLPLCELVQQTGAFYLLGLDQTQCRLFFGTNEDLTPLDVAIPPMSEIQRHIDAEKSLQFHTSAPPGAPRRAAGRQAMYFGHGAGTESETRKEWVAEYFRIVANVVHETLREEQRPLVLVGVEYLHTMYRDANRYPHLVRQGVHGNPESFSEQELLSRAREALADYFKAPTERAISTITEAGDRTLVSHDVAEVVSAAAAGAIDTMVVSEGAQVRGRFDPPTTVEQGVPEQEGEDLLNLAAALTLQANGQVAVVKQEALPSTSVVAAKLRFVSPGAFGAAPVSSLNMSST